MCRTLIKLSEAVLNFFVVSLYTGFGDIVFYFVLEMQSFSLASATSDVSFALSITCIAVTLCLLIFHCIFLIKYRTLKSRSPLDSPQEVQSLLKKYESVKVLYEDFSDTSIFKHGFLGVLVIRDIMISLIITILVPHPLLQSTLLIGLSAAVCIYLMISNPFASWKERASQIFQELSDYFC